MRADEDVVEPPVALEPAQPRRVGIGARPGEPVGAAVAALPRVLPEGAPPRRRVQPAQKADLVGVGGGVEVAAQDPRQLRRHGGDVLVDGNDLIFALAAVGEPIVEVRRVDRDRTGRRRRRRRRGRGAAPPAPRAAARAPAARRSDGATGSPAPPRRRPTASPARSNTACRARAPASPPGSATAPATCRTSCSPMTSGASARSPSAASCIRRSSGGCSPHRLSVTTLSVDIARDASARACESSRHAVATPSTPGRRRRRDRRA